MRTILIFAAMLALAGCGDGKPKTDPAADKDAIGKVRDEFMAAFNANDAAKLGALYADNAMMLPDNQPSLQGRAAIVEHNKAQFDQAKLKISITPHTTTVSGDLAYDEGNFVMEITPKSDVNKTTVEEGRYIVVLQRETDGWKLIEDIDNSSKPAPAPPAKAESHTAKPAAKAAAKTTPRKKK
jgi:uncharacterized protein (TIGR02246 family)